MTPNFSVDLCPPLADGGETSFDEEYQVITNMLVRINHVQAHFSPVLIMQRIIRGFLVRRIVKLEKEVEHWWVLHLLIMLVKILKSIFFIKNSYVYQ